MPPPLESNDNVSLGLINTARDTGKGCVAASNATQHRSKNRHDKRISTLLVGKTGSNSGESTIGSSSNSLSTDPQPIPLRAENQYNPVNWENVKLLLAALPPAVANGSNRSRKPLPIVDLPEFKVVFTTTARQIPRIRTAPPTSLCPVDRSLQQSPTRARSANPVSQSTAAAEAPDRSTSANPVNPTRLISHPSQQLRTQHPKKKQRSV